MWYFLWVVVGDGLGSGRGHLLWLYDKAGCGIYPGCTPANLVGECELGPAGRCESAVDGGDDGVGFS